MIVREKTNYALVDALGILEKSQSNQEIKQTACVINTKLDMNEELHGENFQSFYGFTREKCKTCSDFDICHECKATTSNDDQSIEHSSGSNEFQTPNHPHSLYVNELNDGWRCDGGSIFGKCISGFEDSYKSKNALRYTCRTCLAFDLCQRCLQEPSNSFQSFNHSHPLFKMDLDNDWCCNGGEIFGKCRANMDNKSSKRIGFIRYRCKTCWNFNLCHECLTTPKLANFSSGFTKENTEFTTPHHPHPFFKNDIESGWYCEGWKFFGKCKSGLDDFFKSLGHSRYTCKTCSDFDLCERCLSS